jgi:DNA-binding beta-propeller fold protein YncE
VLALSLRPGQALSGSYGFTPAFAAAVPAAPVAELSGYCTSPGSAAVAVFDRRRKEVVAVLAAGREPQGVALDRTQRRAYVALAGDDKIQDLWPRRRSGEGQIGSSRATRPQRAGADARAPHRRQHGSRTASFLDAASMLERAQVPVGEDQEALLLDRSGGAATSSAALGLITVLDVGSRQVVGAIATDPEPSAAGSTGRSRLSTSSRPGRAYLSVYSLPDLALANRVTWASRQRAQVDPRTGLVYVGRRGEGPARRLQATAFVPVDPSTSPAPPSQLVIDDLRTRSWRCCRSGQVAAVDLTRRRAVAEIDVLPGPHGLAVAGERY